MKLWSLNKVFRFFGFVLVVSFDDKSGTELYFQSKKNYDKGCKK